MNYSFKILCVIALLFSFYQGYSQDQSYIVSTNRPNQTDDIGVMYPGYIQLESGIGFQKTSAGTVSTNTVLIPNLQLRFGLVKNLELNVFYDYNHAQYSSDIQELNLDNHFFVLGSKYHLWKSNGVVPEATAVFNIYYENYNGSSEPLDWELRFIFKNYLSNRLAFAYMLRLRNNLSFTLNPSYAINDNWSVFFEYYSDILFDSQESNQNGINLGLGYLVNNRVTLDLMYGTFFEESVDNYFVTTGVGWWIK